MSETVIRIPWGAKLLAALDIAISGTTHWHGSQSVNVLWCIVWSTSHWHYQRKVGDLENSLGWHLWDRRVLHGRWRLLDWNDSCSHQKAKHSIIYTALVRHTEYCEVRKNYSVPRDGTFSFTLKPGTRYRHVRGRAHRYFRSIGMSTFRDSGSNHSTIVLWGGKYGVRGLGHGGILEKRMLHKWSTRIRNRAGRKENLFKPWVLSMQYTASKLCNVRYLVSDVAGYDALRSTK